jgi:hypothetical protein
MFITLHPFMSESFRAVGRPSPYYEHGAAGPMHNPVRYAAEQESCETLPPMGAGHDEVVALPYFAHGRHGITRADIGGDIELWTG